MANLPSNKLLLGVGAVAVAAGVGYALYRRSRRAKEPSPPVVTTTTSTVPATTTPRPARSTVLRVRDAAVLFDQPSTADGRPVVTMPSGSFVTLLGQQGVWTHVRYPARVLRGSTIPIREGWVNANALEVTGSPPPSEDDTVDFGSVAPPPPPPPPSPATKPAIGRATCLGDRDGCMIYSGPADSTFRLPILISGNQVEIIGEQGSWREVRWNPASGGRSTGWMPAAFLKEEPRLTPTPSQGSSPFGPLMPPPGSSFGRQLVATGRAGEWFAARGRCKTMVCRVISPNLRDIFTVVGGTPLLVSGASPDGRCWPVDPRDPNRGCLPYVVLPDGRQGWTAAQAVEVFS